MPSCPLATASAASKFAGQKQLRSWKVVVVFEPKQHPSHVPAAGPVRLRCGLPAKCH